MEDDDKKPPLSDKQALINLVIYIVGFAFLFWCVVGMMRDCGRSGCGGGAGMW